MKILFLGYEKNSIINFFQNKNYNLTNTSEKIKLSEIREIDPDFIISYGYRHLISKDVIDYYRGKIINLHISYLPWNRGVYPNVWSIIDNTPKGVTIHLLDEGIDTGEILFQREVFFDLEQETLESSYVKLKNNIEDLFIENWQNIVDGNYTPVHQSREHGTFHTKKTSINYFKEIGLHSNWSLKLSDIKARTDEQVINEIQAIRSKNNEHWMDVVKLAFRVSPMEAREIFKKIKFCDHRINELLKELADN